MDDHVREALSLDRSSTARQRTVDITTTGRRSGQPHRIEIWFAHAGDRIYLSRLPGTRDWYANLVADPAFTVHLKNGVTADLAAHAPPRRRRSPTSRRAVAPPDPRRDRRRPQPALQPRLHPPADQRRGLGGRQPPMEVTFDDRPEQANGATT